MPAPPQRHASLRSLNMWNGRSAWFSQTQPVLSQTGQCCRTASPVLAPPPALRIAQLELRDGGGLSSPLVRGLNGPEVLGAGAEN
jgi:hypothetical protein